jgi:hypothetical protein
MHDPDEWDQWRASNRSIENMMRVAQDAVEFAEDEGLAFVDYAQKHGLTVNEVVYYLNAYEAGGIAGLQAIRNPDIISPDIAQDAVKFIAKMLKAGLGEQIPVRVTDEGTAIGVYQIQERSNGEKYLFPVCQFRLTLEEHMWHLYWMRKFDAWWPYPPPEIGKTRFTLRARLQQVLDDEYGCFWG